MGGLAISIEVGGLWHRDQDGKNPANEFIRFAMHPMMEAVKHALNWMRVWPTNQAFKKRLDSLVEGLRCVGGCCLQKTNIQKL